MIDQPGHEAAIVLAPLLRKLDRLSPLGNEDKAAILSLPYKLRHVPAGTHLLRDGDRPDHVTGLRSGFAHLHKLTGDGSRQIVSVHIAGDVVDLHNCLLHASDHNVQTLSAAEIASIPSQALRELSLARPMVGRALWISTLVDAAIYREWVVNVGRRDALTRIAHLLCELSLRLEVAGLAEGGSFELPMTQEQLADATGLTAVHVNRVLRKLGEDGVIQRDRRTVKIGDWRRIARVADFNPHYLHNLLNEQVPAHA